MRCSVLQCLRIAQAVIDVRNYGDPLGLPEARALGASLLSSPAETTLVGEQSSLLLIYQLILSNYLFGLKTPWKDQGNLKFICPVPGFDRHFRLLEDFGIEMLTIPLNGTGVDLDAFHALLAEHENIKGIMCVPRHSNPTGDTYSDENIISIIEAGKAYSEEFLCIFDHAYLLHDFLPSPKPNASLGACNSIRCQGSSGSLLLIFESYIWRWWPSFCCCRKKTF